MAKYKYISRKRNSVVRFVFPNGKEVNLMGTKATVKFAETARSPARSVEIPGATDRDFERILKDDRYKSLHKKIVKQDVQQQPATEDGNKSSKEKE